MIVQAIRCFACSNPRLRWNRIFVFSDLTSGIETYSAGRYLDLSRNPTGIYDLDFNLAYHPYCYYNVSYECPYPPPENRLKVPIHAGRAYRRDAEHYSDLKPATRSY